MAQILVVDDEESIRETLALTLAAAGHEVVVAPNGNGISGLLSPHPDILITDIIMPGRDGFETIREVRGHHPEVKIIAISGGGRLDPEEYLDIAAKLGADRVLTKPVPRDVLLKTVAEALSSDS